MPVRYVINKPGEFIHTRCVGEVTLDEVIEHFDTLVQDSDCPERLDVLLDLSAITSIPEIAQLWTVSEKIGETLSRVQFGLCAIVAIRPVLFGMTRMFQALSEEDFSAVRVFNNQDEARDWMTKEKG
jgi:hypothetical protein